MLYFVSVSFFLLIIYLQWKLLNDNFANLNCWVFQVGPYLVIFSPFFLQCNYVFVRHGWKGTLIQEVSGDHYNILCVHHSFRLQPICFQTCFILCSCRAFVFFSSPIPRELVMEIKKDVRVLPRLGALREVKIFY